jgi:hypothetical protein
LCSFGVDFVLFVGLRRQSLARQHRRHCQLKWSHWAIHINGGGSGGPSNKVDFAVDVAA